MRVVIQRVTSASVHVLDEAGASERARIGPGLVALVGFGNDEDEEAIVWMAAKLADLRVFPGDGGDMDRSVREAGGQLLLVSQFTLYGDVRKGRRPDFGAAARYEKAERLYDRFYAACDEQLPGRVETGEFGARMRVDIANDGPVTLVLQR